MRSNLGLAIGVVFGLASLLPWSVEGQAGPRSDGAAVRAELERRVPVTIALLGSLPQPASKAVILRRKTATPHDIILLDSRVASGRDLSAAIFTLLAARDINGDTTAADMTIRVPDGTGRSYLGKRDLRRSEAAVRKLHASNPTFLAGFGSVRAFDLWLPSTARRNSSAFPGVARK